MPVLTNRVVRTLLSGENLRVRQHVERRQRLHVHAVQHLGQSGQQRRLALHAVRRRLVLKNG